MTYTTTPRPDPVLTAIRTRASNQNRELTKLRDENRQLREQVERLQSLVEDHSDALEERLRSRERELRQEFERQKESIRQGGASLFAADLLALVEYEANRGKTRIQRLNAVLMRLRREAAK